MPYDKPKRLFGPMPLRAMADELSGLQLRVLICVAAHDRMSLVTGKGQGCRASNQRMAELVGCNYSRLCSTLTELAEGGFVTRDKLPLIGRRGWHTVYRVIYTDADRALFDKVSHRQSTCHLASESGPDQLAAQQLNAPGPTCQAARNEPGLTCRDVPQSDENPPKPASQYIPLNGGIDSEETGEKNSVETARLTARGSARKEFENNPGGQMARFERSWKADPGEFSLDELEAWAVYLEEIQHAFECGDPEYHRAQRLGYLVDDRIRELSVDAPAGQTFR